MHATTLSDAPWYRYQFISFGVSGNVPSKSHEFVPIVFRGHHHSSRCFLHSVRDVHSVWCKWFARAAILRVSSRLDCTQRIVLVILCVFSRFLEAGAEMVLKFPAPVSRMNIYVCLGSSSHMISFRGSHDSVQYSRLFGHVVFSHHDLFLSKTSSSTLRMTIQGPLLQRMSTNHLRERVP